MTEYPIISYRLSSRSHMYLNSLIPPRFSIHSTALYPPPATQQNTQSPYPSRRFNPSNKLTTYYNNYGFLQHPHSSPYPLPRLVRISLFPSSSFFATTNPLDSALAGMNCKCQDDRGQFNEATRTCCSRQSNPLTYYPGPNNQVTSVLPLCSGQCR